MKPQTIDKYEYQLDRYVVPFLGEKRLNELGIVSAPHQLGGGEWHSGRQRHGDHSGWGAERVPVVRWPPTPSS